MTENCIQFIVFQYHTSFFCLFKIFFSVRVFYYVTEFCKVSKSKVTLIPNIWGEVSELNFNFFWKNYLLHFYLLHGRINFCCYSPFISFWIFGSWLLFLRPCASARVMRIWARFMVLDLSQYNA